MAELLTIVALVLVALNVGFVLGAWFATHASRIKRIELVEPVIEERVPSAAGGSP